MAGIRGVGDGATNGQIRVQVDRVGGDLEQLLALLVHPADIFDIPSTLIVPLPFIGVLLWPLRSAKMVGT